MYQNEAETGACIAASGVPRDEFCITSKVPPANFEEAKLLPSVEQSLIVDFNLTNTDMKEINKLTRLNHRIVNKNIVPWAPDWD